MRQDRVDLCVGELCEKLAAPQDLYESPANLFVASFIGSPPMNLYEGAIAGSTDEPVLALGSQRLALPTDLGERRPGLAAGEARTLVVGIRPEHLTVAEGESVDRGPTLAATVELVEALGNESLVHFSTDARTVRNRGGVWTADPAATLASGDIASASAAEGVARVDPRVRVSVGERVALAVDVHRLHFFDAETGDSIGATGLREGGGLQELSRSGRESPGAAT